MPRSYDNFFRGFSDSDLKMIFWTNSLPDGQGECVRIRILLDEHFEKLNGALADLRGDNSLCMNVFIYIYI